jgi:hypothetical protein
MGVLWFSMFGLSRLHPEEVDHRCRQWHVLGAWRRQLVLEWRNMFVVLSIPCFLRASLPRS